MNAQRRQWLRSAGGRKGFLMRGPRDFLNRLKRLAASFCVLPVLAAAASDAAAAPCSGRIINPITDVCWSCLFPITLGTGIPLSAKGGLPDVSTDANAICTCGSNANLSAGLNMGFWEPLRTAEIVRHPFCFPSLGGIEMKGAGNAVRASSHGRTAARTAITAARPFIKSIGIKRPGYLSSRRSLTTAASSRRPGISPT